MKRYLGIGLMVILLVGFGLTTRANKSVREVRSVETKTSRLPTSWIACSVDSDCVYIPHPCCTGWTSGSFNLAVVRNKPVDTSVCDPKPAECISAQPAIPNGKVIRPVCREKKCRIEFVDKNLFEPVRMGIPCKESKQCPQPAGVCGKDGFCIEGNR